MKSSQTENALILIEMPAFWRRVSAGFLIFALASFVFAYYGAFYFGARNTTSIIVYIVISIILGLVFLFLGYMLASLPDRKLEINKVTGKIILTEKFFRTSSEEFSFNEIEKVEMITGELENSSFYKPQIVLRDGKIIRIPSDNQGDEKKQTEIFEQVRKFLAK